MKLITTQDLVNNIIRRYLDQYPIDKPFTFVDGTTSTQRLNELKNLNPKTADGINKIMGNDSWTTIHCDECQENVTEVIELGKLDFESNTANICPECLKKAINLIKQLK